MPRWPISLLFKFFAEPRIAISGATATAEAFLPSPGDAPTIQLGPRGHARAAARRLARRPRSRRRLVS